MSYHIWLYISLTVRRARSYIITGTLPVYFALKDLCPVRSSVQCACKKNKKRACVGPRQRGDWGWIQLSQGQHSCSGGVGGGKHIKELTTVAFTLALIVSALIWHPCCAVLSSHNLCHLWKHRSGTEAELVSLSPQQFSQLFFFFFSRHESP